MPYDIGFGNDFLDMIPQAQVTKEKIRQTGPREKFKILYIKRHNPQSKRQPTEWEKMFANNISDKD